MVILFNQLLPLFLVRMLKMKWLFNVVRIKQGSVSVAVVSLNAVACHKDADHLSDVDMYGGEH